LALNLYLDDCVYSKSLANLLRQAGHTVIVPVDAGLTGADDVAHMEYAAGASLVLITKNPADFEILHRLFPKHAGVVAIYQDNDITRDMSDPEIVKALEALESASKLGLQLAGEFHILNHWRT
jgi:predicted nuclease of predicted toxin-antitoxin system